MDAKTLKQLTGAKTKVIAYNMICERLMKRKWTIDGQAAEWGGCNYKDTVSFYQVASLDVGSCFCRTIKVKIEDALDCISGKLSSDMRII